MSHNAVHSYATALATALLLIAVFSPGAAAAVLCGTMPGPVLNSASGAATPAWINGDGDACINQTVATVCTANCRPGYTSWPAPSITCQANGTWTPPTSHCTPVCVDPPAIVAGITWGSSGPGSNNNCAGSIGQKASCAGACTAVGKSGSPVARCVGTDAKLRTTSWAYSGGCVGDGGCASGPSTVPSNAKPSGLTGCISGDNDTACELECKTNYTPDTAAGVKTTCVNGAWVTSGKCLRACTSAPTGSATLIWDILCAGKPAGYVCQGLCIGGTEGAPSITCSAAGTWTRQSGACAPTGGCPTLPPGVKNAGPAPASCAGTANTLPCTFTCNNGSSPFITYGPSAGSAVTRTCNAGTWSNASADCIQVCRASTLPALGSGTWAPCTTVAVGGTCMATCGAGEYGAPYSVCSSKGFGPLVGECSITKVCAGAPTVATLNGQWPIECSNTAAGDACEIACNIGYTGNATVACVANGDNLVTGANWATKSTGVMCAPALPGRKLI